MEHIHPEHIFSSVRPEGGWRYGLHRPAFAVKNMRITTDIKRLGSSATGPCVNEKNYPSGDVHVDRATPIFEIPNAFPFRGRTYIDTVRADKMAESHSFFAQKTPMPCSFFSCFEKQKLPSGKNNVREIFHALPAQVLLALAKVSTDVRDLEVLADMACSMEYDDTGVPIGIKHSETGKNGIGPIIHDHDLFETLVNNPSLPDFHKRAMVLRPGIQGSSEIVGEFGSPGASTHVYEYLRRNSYIPFGHYATNMADDAVRYSLGELSLEDFHGLRHLYYQRTFLRFADELAIQCPKSRTCLDTHELEDLRVATLQAMKQGGIPFSDTTLWGWNYGYDFSPSGFRLNASHQQIHQQYALVPATVSLAQGKDSSLLASFCCGDLVREWVEEFQSRHGVSFFQAMEKSLRTNQRIDGRDDLPSELIVQETDDVILFVPKAQTSHWELQVMPTRDVGLVLEADLRMRQGLDRAIWTGMRILHACGARLITAIEYSKRISAGDNGQRIVYDLLPKMEHSPMTFSQTQHRWIVGHYPEDFAAACRHHLVDLEG